MASWALWINLVGNGLVVLGLGWAGWSLLGAEKGIQRDRATLVEIHDRHAQLRESNDPTYDPEAADEERRQSGIDFTTFNDLMYLNQDIQLAIISHLKPSIKGPFLATLLGTVLTLVAAILSFG